MHSDRLQPRHFDQLWLLQLRRPDCHLRVLLHLLQYLGPGYILVDARLEASRVGVQRPVNLAYFAN